MSLIHAYVESLRGVSAVFNANIGDKTSWWTTSPYLLKKMARQGLDIRSPEVFLDRDECNCLAKACYDVAIDFTARLDAQCLWREGIPLKILAGNLWNCLYVAVYKGLLLEIVLKNAELENAKVLCCGMSESTPLGEAGLAFGRYDTVPVILASRWKRQGLKVLEIQHDPEYIRRLEEEAIEGRLGPLGKLISLLSNTPSSFLYKVASKFLRGRGIRLFPFGRFGGTTFYVYNSSELVEELFLGLLFRGARMEFADELPSFVVERVNRAVPEVSILKEELGDAFSIAIRRWGIQEYEAYNPAIELTAEKVQRELAVLRGNLSSIKNALEARVRDMRRQTVVLTSAFSRIPEKLFYYACRKGGVPTVASSHGITMGLSELMEWRKHFSPMQYADAGIYHNWAEIKAMEEVAPQQEKVVGGLPMVTTRIRLHSLMRILGRLWMGIGIRDHVVLFAANSEMNNMQLAPYYENDDDFIKETEFISKYLRCKYPGSILVLKLYNTKRYEETEQFDYLKADEIVNIVVKNIDLRFLRAACDVIACSSAQSTLGWVACARARSLLFEFAFAPFRIQGNKLLAGGRKKDWRLTQIDSSHPELESRGLRRIYEFLHNVSGLNNEIEERYESAH